MNEIKSYPIDFTEEELEEAEEIDHKDKTNYKRAKRRADKNIPIQKRERLHGDVTKPHLRQEFNVEIIKSPRNF